MITERVSMTNTPPIIIRMISSFNKTATVAIAPPSASEPVSPMNTFAGCALKTKKPRSAPTTATAKMDTSNCDWYHARTANAPKATEAVPETRPSRPSVRLTALEKPTNQNIRKRT